MDAVDKNIKEYLEKERSRRSLGSRGGYPSDEELFLFVTDKLEGKELKRMLDHLRAVPEDMEMVSRARELAEGEASFQGSGVPISLTNNAKALFREKLKTNCPHCGKPITPFKKPLKSQWFWGIFWLVLSLAGFTLSFVFHRFFLQCLALGLLAGFKWILDRRSTKSQILIYKALKDEEPLAHSHRDLHRHSTEL